MKRYLIAILVGLVPTSAEAVQWLKQSTAVTVKVGPFVDSSDASAETALTISQADIRLSKNGGAFAQTNNATGATHDENGYYGVPLDTTDTNTLGTLKIAVAESGTLAVWQDFMVVPENVYDSLVGGSDYIQTDLTQVGGTAAASALASASDVVDEFETQSQADPTGFHVNVLEVAGTAQTANDNSADINAILDDTGTSGVLLSSGTGAGQISLSSGAVQITNANISTIVSTNWNYAIAGASGTPGSTAEALAGIWTDTNAVDTQTEMRTFLTGDDSPVLAEDNLPSNFSSLEINGSGAVDSMLQGFLDNTIAESTANNIATNFEVFFDNGDSVSTSVIDDVQSGGLDAAGVRAALGMAAADLDTQLDGIVGYVDDIGVAGAGLTAVPWNASWDAEVQSEAQDALTASIGANGASLSAIPWNATWDAEVQSEAADALTAYDPPTDTEMDAQFSAIDAKVDIIDTNVDDVETAVGALDLANSGPVNFLPASDYYTLRVTRRGGITPNASRTITAGEKPVIQFAFNDILNRRLLTSVAEPTSDSANVTITDYGINGVGDGGKGINVVLDCTNAVAGEQVTISVSVTAGGLVYKASHTFTITE